MIKKNRLLSPMMIKTLRPDQLCILPVPSSIYTNGLGTEETRRRYGEGTAKRGISPRERVVCRNENGFRLARLMLFFGF